jgi:hypothetical protein
VEGWGAIRFKSPTGAWPLSGLTADKEIIRLSTALSFAAFRSRPHVLSQAGGGTFTPHTAYMYVLYIYISNSRQEIAEEAG